MNNALLPPNATAAERAQALAMARLADIAPQCRAMWNPDSCPASHLPWLAWAFSVDEWNTAWTEAQKRSVIRAAFNVHQHKGTVGAMRAALDAIGYEIELLEWFRESPQGQPFTFGLTAELDDRGIAPGLWDEIQSIAIAAKNARSHLRYVRLRASVSGRFYVGGTTLSAETIEVQPWQLTALETHAPLCAGAALIVIETLELRPLGEPVLALLDGMPLPLIDGAPLRFLN